MVALLAASMVASMADWKVVRKADQKAGLMVAWMAAKMAD
jgi:hypothetical protein